jgi:tRNA(fMet)-specific endonuclease VapC
MAVRLLDTNIVSFLIKSHPLAAAYRPHISGHILAVSFQTVAELLEWALHANWGPGKKSRLTKTISGFLVYDSNDVICRHWSEVRNARRRRPIDCADAWIAATALAYDFELITHNPTDFQGIPGLVIITEAP